MLLIVGKGIRGGNVMQFIAMQKLIMNIWKIMIKLNNYHFYIIGM